MRKRIFGIPMKLYRHYKNKYYRYLDRVKHSESLETLVLYEALYENALGKLWVRPETMFHETIEYQGTRQARFAPVSLAIQSHELITPDLQAQVLNVASLWSDSWQADVFAERIQGFPKLHLGLAYLDGNLVGFKLGYGVDAETFYSWLGGVHPDFRGLGVATALIQNQTDWCLAQGFKRIQTECLNVDRELIQINGNFGFLIIDIQEANEGRKLIFEKNLVEP